MGIVQGITEFIPVSSSGHLVLLKHIFGLDLGEAPLLMDTILHLGTLGAVLMVFFADLQAMVMDTWTVWSQGDWRQGWQTRPHLRLVVWLAVATVPAVIIGLALEDAFTKAFSSANTVGWALLINGLVLLASRLLPPGMADLPRLRVWQALLVGLAQAVAITPGISRAGSTITAGLAVGMNRDTAGRFSFLLSLPAIFGAVLLEFIRFQQAPAGFWWAAAVGFAVSLVVGYAALRLLLRFVRQGRLHWFGIYCLLVGGGAIWLA